jgi:RHH-type proline utilization regulon transcriptional repressor/proline dehydrogenase/delta 1-pyrroline-5-carboxylate dehydrogenase
LVGKLGRSDSAFVNAATFSLLLTGKVLEGAQDRSDNWKAALGRAVGRLGEPVVRTAVREAMKILGRNFVFGRDIDEALQRAAPERRRGLSHSFDMLAKRPRPSRMPSGTPTPIAARSIASPRRRRTVSANPRGFRSS